MGAKKKSKTNKLARMSEEEKLRYLQHRAAIEEEARRRKEQLISTFMKNKLKHEDAFSRLNSAKINQQWRQTLRHIKNNELHDAAETLRQTFNVAVETKNKIIQTLLADLDDSVAMHNLAVQTHLESINKIIGIQEERLKTLHSAYIGEREYKLQEAEIARSRGLETHEQDKKNLELKMFWQKVYHDNNNERMKKMSEDFNNDQKYQVMSEMRMEEDRSAKIIENLKNEMQAILKNYENALSPYIAHYKQLRNDDMKDMRQHIENGKTIHVKETYLKKLENIYKSKENFLQSTTDGFNRIINEEKKTFNDLRMTLKGSQSKHEKNMNHLSSASNMALKHLGNILSKLNGILQLNSSSKKFLTERELFNSSNVEPFPISCDADTKDTEGITENFWKHYSEVLVEVTSLSAHHANFVDENINLKHSLVKYMNTVSKPSSLTSCLFRDSTRNQT